MWHYLLTVSPLTIILAFIFYTYWYQNLSSIAKSIKDLPGPGIPIFGVFLDYLTSDRIKIFQNDRDRCKKYSPIFKLWIFDNASVILQNPEDIEIILSSTKHITKSIIYDNLHMWLGTGLLTSTGNKWKNRRRLLTPAFHFTILKQFVTVFNEATQKLVENIQEHQQNGIDIIPPITQFTLHAIAETAMGTDLHSKQSFYRNYKNAMTEFIEVTLRRLSKPLLYHEFIFRLWPPSSRAYKAVSVLHDITRNIIKERKRDFTGQSYADTKKLTMLDLLLKVQEQNGLIEDEGIREEVDTFMFEGHDTTSVSLCYLLIEIANNERIQSEIRQEILDVVGESAAPTYSNLQDLQYTERCIKESLRLYPSVVLIGRTAEENIKITNNRIIPKGSGIHIFIFDLHRDPNIYPNPLKFDPDRFLPENSSKRHPFAYIPFSAGSRNCIGQRFALLELKAVLCGLLREFRLEPIDKPEDLVFMADVVLRSKNPIRIKFIKRNKSVL